MADGVRVGRKRVERLMRQAGITGMVARKRGRTTIRVPGVRVCEDLVDRAFLAAAPNRLWVADITYLRTWEGWLYLVAVQDVFRRRIVGWSMADHMRTELVTDALRWRSRSAGPPPGLIWHSDQGSQFVSLAFGQQAARRRDRPIDGLRAATASITPSPRASSRPRRRSSSTAAPGHRRPSSGPRSSSTSRSSSTAAAGTPRSGFSRPRSSRQTPTMTEKITTTATAAPNHPVSTEAGELHRTASVRWSLQRFWLRNRYGDRAAAASSLLAV